MIKHNSSPSSHPPRNILYFSDMSSSFLLLLLERNSSVSSVLFYFNLTTPHHSQCLPTPQWCTLFWFPRNMRRVKWNEVEWFLWRFLLFFSVLKAHNFIIFIFLREIYLKKIIKWMKVEGLICIRIRAYKHI